MDALMRALHTGLQEMCEELERTDLGTLEQWAQEDSIRGMFAQKELVYRDQLRVIDAEVSND